MEKVFPASYLCKRVIWTVHKLAGARYCMLMKCAPYASERTHEVFSICASCAKDLWPLRAKKMHERWQKQFLVSTNLESQPYSSRHSPTTRIPRPKVILMLSLLEDGWIVKPKVSFTGVHFTSWLITSWHDRAMNFSHTLTHFSHTLSLDGSGNVLKECNQSRFRIQPGRIFFSPISITTGSSQGKTKRDAYFNWFFAHHVKHWPFATFYNKLALMNDKNGNTLDHTARWKFFKNTCSFTQAAFVALNSPALLISTAPVRRSHRRTSGSQARVTWEL